MKKFKALYAFMLAFFNAKTLIEDGSINLTEEQKQQLQDALGEKVRLSEVVTQMNQELADAAKDESGGDQVLADLKKEAMEMLIAHGLSQQDAEEAAENPKGSKADGDAEMKQILAGLIEHNKKTDKMLETLLKDPEEDTPIAKGNLNMKNLAHSNSHFLGSGKAYDAFEDRNWNKRAAGLSTTPTDFADEKGFEIQKLKDDVDLYYRENPTEIKSLFRDLLGLPSNWDIRTRVDDRVADGNIVSGEISQGRKLPWLPKNKQLIQPEESKIFPVHIDIEFIGYYLQQIEASWLNSWNKEGSQPYKWSFVRFLLSELDKKARQEDRMVSINGVFVKTPENATIPGNAINRGDGILIQLWRAYFYDQKFKIANIGLPTDANIVDYIPQLLEKNIPEESKNADNLIIYLSPTWLKKYKIRYRQLYGMENDYSRDGVMDIENYPNVKFQTLRDLEGSDFMLVTFADNIQLMENIPAEKSMYHFDTLKRIIYIYADYKWGVRFKHIGTKVKDTDPVAFKVQTVWCNIPPTLHKTFVSLYDDATGEVNLPYSNIEVKADWVTNITDIKNVYPGQIVKVRGNTLATGSVKHDAAKIALTGSADFALSTGGTLTLVVEPDLKLKEIKRTGAPEVNPESTVNFNTAAIDANEGTDFQFLAGADVVMTEILNGFDGQTITIKGAAGNTVTVSDVDGNINVGASRVVNGAADFVKLTRVDGVWEEVGFNITE
ncbi:MAG TPA: hypothetical protein VLY84_00210 [Dysgonamonadaceae bacterium]|nr:hypothetical protein [Dysgonamonadaceae bacterium]